MKFLKYLAAVLVVLAIVAAVLHFKREAIARNIANSALSGQGLVATDLSIDTLATDHIIFSHLVLEQADGTRYELKGLRFPLSFPSLRPETITITELRMIVRQPSNEPLAVAKVLQTLLALPQSIPNTAIAIGAFSTAELPPIENIQWQSFGDSQQIGLDIGQARVQANVERDSAEQYQATVGVAMDGHTDLLHVPLTIVRQPSGFAINGHAAIDIPPWFPLLHSMEWLPAGLAAFDATLAGPIAFYVDDDSLQPIEGSGAFAIGGRRTATYEYGDDAFDIRFAEPDTVDLKLVYPTLDWTVGIARAELRPAAYPAARATVEDLTCHAGIHCTMRFSAEGESFNLDGIEIGGANISSSVAMDIGDETRFQLAPNTSLALNNVGFDTTSIAVLAVSGLSNANVVISNGGWGADVAQMSIDINTLAVGERLVTSFPAVIKSLRIRKDASQVDFAYAIPALDRTIAWNDAEVVAPGISGTLRLADDAVAVKIELADDANSLASSVSALHRVSTGTGSATVRNTSLQFDRRKLSAWWRSWPNSWDIVAGSWTASADIEWQPHEGGLQFRGWIRQSVAALAGHYGDVVFTGLATDLSATLGEDGSVAVDPATIDVALLDVGVPIENLSAHLDLDVAKTQLAVRDLTMSALGGKILADPFVYAAQQDSNNIMLRPQSIQLQFMVDLAEFDDIELSGSISGRIPVHIGNEAITVTDGRLESDAPGGVIRYRAGSATAAMNNSNINIASRALGNFQFDSLTSDVDYTETGDLKLKMRLSGINPDMDPRQPVILNLGVENNIPQLLRSLQATRAIEDVLKKKGQN